MPGPGLLISSPSALAEGWPFVSPVGEKSIVGPSQIAGTPPCALGVPSLLMSWIACRAPLWLKAYRRCRVGRRSRSLCRAEWADWAQLIAVAFGSGSRTRHEAVTALQTNWLALLAQLRHVLIGSTTPSLSVSLHSDYDWLLQLVERHQYRAGSPCSPRHRGQPSSFKNGPVPRD